jgi:hypothetical protein
MLWRRLLGNVATATASTLFAVLVLEFGLRFMPVAWAPPVEPPTAANPIQRYAANTPYTWSLGWDFYVVVRGHTNAQGFIADYDYDATATTPLVAVIGDSFIEALQVAFAETVTGRLQAALGPRGRAYAFAQSGSPLSQYVAYAEHAAAYRPQKLVVSVVENDFNESVHAHRSRDGIYHLYPRPDGNFEFKLTPLPESGALQWVLRHSALALYLARNVGVAQLLDRWRYSPAGFGSGHAVAATPVSIDEGQAVIDWFLAALPKAAALAPSDIVIAVDAERPRGVGAPPVPYSRHQSYFQALRTSLIEAARTMGFAVVDLEPSFRAAYMKDQAPFEFATDGHWNSHGHAVVTDAVLIALDGWAPLAPKR